MIRNDTDYALRMLLYLSEQQPAEIGTTELSDRLHVPHSFAQKILRKLAAAGIIHVKCGRLGGFRMAKQAVDVSLMDVISVIQGTPLLNRCTGNTGTCVRQPSCRINTSLNIIQDKLNLFLSGMSLSDILRQTSSQTKAIVKSGRTRVATERRLTQSGLRRSR